MTEKTEKFVEKTVDVVQQINRFNNSINIGKNGKDLNKVINVLTGSSLSKLSASLGLVGATFGVISLFTSSKSTDEIIIDMLGDLEDKIDSLQSLMLGQFEHLEAVVEKVGANETLSSAFAKIDSVKYTLDSFLTASSEEKRHAHLEILRQNKSMKMRDAVLEIMQTVNDGELYNNVYDANLNSSYGDSVSVQNIGVTLNYYLNLAKLIGDFLDCLHIIPQDKWCSIEIKEGQNPLDSVPDEYLSKLECALEINTEFHAKFISKNEEKWLSVLEKSKNECSDYIEKFLKTELFPKVSAKEHKRSVNDIVNGLSVKWGWLDFFAVVYDDVTGFKRHAMSGLSNGRHTYFRESVAKGKVNIVVAWKDKDEPEKGSTHNTKVSYDYTTMKSNGFFNKKVKENYTGNAEKYKHWHELTDVLNTLVDNRPNNNRFIWVAEKKQAASRAETNTKRLNWVDGKYLDIAIFE